MTGKYAATTDVPVSRSRDEIERTLNRFGASAYGYATQGANVLITFEVQGLRVMFRMTMPDRRDFQFDSRMRQRAESTIEREWEQACRQRWRSLANAIKAKLAAVDDGIATVEQEFLAYVALPGEGGTVGDRIIPEMREAIRNGELPPLMPGLPQGRVIALGSGR